MVVEEPLIIGASGIEDSVWSPIWGLSGVIDATLAVALPHRASASHALLPLEIKTGKRTSETRTHHRAQVSLYALLMADRFPLANPVPGASPLSPSRQHALTVGIATGAQQQGSWSGGIHTAHSSSGDEPLAGLLLYVQAPGSSALRSSHSSPLPGSMEGDLQGWKLSPLKAATNDNIMGTWTEEVPSTWMEQRALLQLRNELAKAIQGSFLVENGEKYAQERRQQQ